MTTWTLTWQGDTDDIDGLTALAESDTAHIHSAYGLSEATLTVGSNDPTDLLAEPVVEEEPVEEEVPDGTEVQPDPGLDGTGTPNSSQ